PREARLELMLPLLSEPEPLVPSDSARCLLDIENRHDFLGHLAEVSAALRRQSGGAYSRSSVSRRPDQLSVRRQHPASGTSTIEGPGPVRMILRIGAPT